MPPLSSGTGCARRNQCVFGSLFCMRKKIIGITAPTGKALRRVVYCPPVPKTLRAPMLPNRTAAEKYVLTPGQVNLLFWSLFEQTSQSREIRLWMRGATHDSQISRMLWIWKFITPVHTNADTKVAAA